MRLGKHLFGFGVASFLVISMSACNMDIRDYCEARNNCLGGNDADEDACVEQYDGQEDAADEYDCEDQFDAMMECWAAHMECNESEYYGETYTNFTDDGECDEDEQKYHECINDASSYYDD